MQIFIQNTHLTLNKPAKIGEEQQYAEVIDLKFQPLDLLYLKDNSLIKNPSETKLLELIFFLIEQKNHIQRISVSTENLITLKKFLMQKFVHIKAGGGVIMQQHETKQTTENAKTLLIYRRNMWDLPKGKMDENETFEQTAVREVAEETGLHCQLQHKVATTWHYYKSHNLHYLKQTKWYKMLCDHKAVPVPQVEEDIENIGFYTQTQLKDILPKAFGSISWVLKKAQVVE